MPPVKVSSWRTRARLVFRTLSNTVPSSQGSNVRRSMISIDAPEAAAAASAHCTPSPYVMMVASVPDCTVSAFPNSMA